jgi:hypothetical protein
MACRNYEVLCDGELVDHIVAENADDAIQIACQEDPWLDPDNMTAKAI